MAEALNSLQDLEEPDILVVYGDFSFSSGGWGQNSIPVKWFKESCKN